MEKEVIIFGVSEFYALKENSWSGALQVLEQVEKKGLEDEVLDLINSLIECCEGGIEETKLNDYIWFDLEEDLKEYNNIDLWGDDEDENNTK